MSSSPDATEECRTPQVGSGRRGQFTISNVAVLLGLLLVAKVIILVVAYIATNGVPPNLPIPGPVFPPPIPANVTVAFNPGIPHGWPAVLYSVGTSWDGALYQQIASEGYVGTASSLYAFSPLYPALISLADLGTGSYWMSALVVANAVGFVFPVLLLRLFDFRTALIAEMFPTYLVFTSVGYSDGLALVFLGLSFVLFLRRHYAYAGVALAAAGVVLYDLFLAAPAFVAYLLIFGTRQERRRSSYAAVLLPSVIAGSIILLWYRIATGSAFTFFALESQNWGVALTNPVGQALWIFDGSGQGSFNVVTWSVLGTTLTDPYWLVRNVLFEAFVFAGIALLAGMSSLGERRWLFVLYSLAVSVPLLFVDGTPVYSVPRLLLPAFPVFYAYSRRVVTKDWRVAAYLVASLTVASLAIVSFIYAFFA